LFLAFFPAFLGLVWLFFKKNCLFLLFSAHLNRKCAFQNSSNLEEKKDKQNAIFPKNLKIIIIIIIIIIKTLSFPKIAYKSPKYALKSSKSTTHRGENYLTFFKSAFGVFLAFFRAESGVFRLLASGNAGFRSFRSV
jgi:uncharacterized membrane protein